MGRCRVDVAGSEGGLGRPYFELKIESVSGSASMFYAIQ